MILFMMTDSVGHKCQKKALESSLIQQAAEVKNPGSKQETSRKPKQTSRKQEIRRETIEITYSGETDRERGGAGLKYTGETHQVITATGKKTSMQD